MLVTPLGQIKIYIDGMLVPYTEKPIANDKTCRDLDGRYTIEITFIPDGEMHTISCCLYNYEKSDDDDIESGERLELKSFCQGSVKLSIGMEGDIGYLSNGVRISEYDYDNSYLDNGVQFEILPDTKTSKYVFGIAWLNKVNDKNEVQTWYGADPSIM
jgi:hypothetical protein